MIQMSDGRIENVYRMEELYSEAKWFVFKQSRTVYMSGFKALAIRGNIVGNRQLETSVRVELLGPSTYIHDSGKPGMYVATLGD